MFLLAAEFPPRWFPSLLRRTFSVTKNLLAVGAGYLSYTATVRSIYQWLAPLFFVAGLRQPLRRG